MQTGRQRANKQPAKLAQEQQACVMILKSSDYLIKVNSQGKQKASSFMLLCQ